MRKTKRFTPDLFDRYKELGRGTGTFEHYMPFHRVGRSDPSSRGRSHLERWRGRAHELLSDGELVTFLFATMLPNIVDIHKDASIAFERFYESLKDIKEVLLLTKHHLFEKQAKVLFNHSEIRLNRPLIIPMLILWLYGNWQLFSNAYDWEVTLSSGAEHLYTKPLKAKLSSSDPARSICKAFILENPQCVRKDFYKLHLRPYRWLQKYDREWFEKILPSPPSHKSRQFKLF